jgi:DNA-binding transcriptional LysR family regulator
VPQTPGELAAHSIVAASSLSPTPEWRFVDRGAPLVVKVRSRLSTTSNDSAIEAAIAGFGLTRLLSYQVSGPLREEQLKVVLSEFETAPMPVHLVHHEGRYAARKTRAFIDMAVERLRADPALN